MIAPSACSYSWEIGKGGSGGTSASGEGGASTSTTTAPDCAALQKAMDSARVEAQACSYAGAQVQGECKQAVTDACGCEAFVKDAASTQAKGFTSAVGAFSAAGCTSQCGSCSPLQAGTCLQAGSVIHCVP